MRSPCTTTNSSPHLPQLEKACVQQRKPNAAKHKINKFLFIYLVIYLWLCWVLLLRAGSPQLRRARAAPRHGARASHCSGLSRCGARAPGTQASVVLAHGLSSCGLRALERSLSSCGASAQPLRGMWDPPGPGLKPTFPALAGGFSTTAPPRKPKINFY